MERRKFTREFKQEAVKLITERGVTEVIDWKLIETHFPDMLRAVISIKKGKIKASTILRANRNI